METLYVIKIGGNILNNPDLLEESLNQISQITEKVVLVHGGGNILDELASALNVPQKKVAGRRVTNQETIDLALMVYAGLLGKKIVARLYSKGKKAIGLSGADGAIILAGKRSVSDMDYGMVGDIIGNGVEKSLLKDFLNKDILPVFNSITMSEEGELLNTNADTVAAELAKVLVDEFKVELIYCLEKNGVLTNISDEFSVIRKMNYDKYCQLRGEKVITDGMIPKLENSFEAINAGVNSVKITIGNKLNDATNENEFKGTLLTK